METLVQQSESKHKEIDSVINKGRRVDIIQSLDRVQFSLSSKCNEHSDALSFDLEIPLTEKRMPFASSVMSNFKEDRSLQFEGTSYFLDSMYREIGGSGFVKYAQHLKNTRQVDLLEKNVNDQLRLNTKAFMLRGLQSEDGTGIMRALLSTKYKRINDDVVHNIVGAIMSNNPKFKCLGGGSTVKHTYVRYVTVEPILIGKRKLHFGFQWKNSEVGAGFFELEIFMCDGYCDNGMIVNLVEIDSFKKMHRGRDNFRASFGVLSQETSYGMNREIGNAIHRVTSEDNMMRVQESVLSSFRMPFEGDHEKVIEQVGKRYKLSDEIVAQAIEDFDTGERHAYGLQAAFTSAAQKQSSFDLRDQIDRIGGEIIQKDKDEFDKLVVLAA